MKTTEILEDWKIKITELYPTAEINIDAPDDENGNYFFDIECVGPILTVEIHPHEGAGFYADDAEYGEGPVEFIQDLTVALGRVLFLLSKRSESEKMPTMFVSEK